MKTRLGFKTFIIILILFLTGTFAGTGMCQEINLDKMKKFNDLVCYQSLKDPVIWYYLPDQPRLAMKNGKPQFSFMKYSRTQKTGKAGTNRAEGGGIVHFLVTYGTSKDRVRAAERRLQEKQPDAHIEGPIVYRKGSFALITSFQKDQETLVRTVAIGKAPLMEGQKAAVSMALSREGAELLWQSFKSDTPDISLVFDMEFVGVREPYEATIEADWSRISKHKRLKAGMKYSWFGADVDMLFQELRQDGAIKITTKGENASMDKIIESAHAKLLQVMFDPAPVDDLSKAAAEKDSYSNLNQAMKMMKDSGGKKSSLNLSSPGFRQLMASILDLLVTDAQAADAPELPPLPLDSEIGDNSKELTPEQLTSLRKLYLRGEALLYEKKYQEAIDVFQKCIETHLELTGNPLPSGNTKYYIATCLEKLGRYNEAEDYYRQAADGWDKRPENRRAAIAKAEQARELAQKDSRQNDTASNTNTDSSKQAPAVSASDAYNMARHLDKEAKDAGYPPYAVQEAINAYERYQHDHSPSGSRAREVEGRLRSLNKRLAEAASEELGETPVAPVPPPISIKPTPSGSKNKTPVKAQVKPKVKTSTPAAGTAKASTPTAKKAEKPIAKKKTTAAKKPRVADGKPGFSLVASFQMKNIKRSGRMVYHMNHFRSEKQSFTMAENIGSLYRRYGNDSRIFKAVTIDDPVFKQREILVTLDGQDASTFTKYLNFVTVKMNKRHQSGSITNDEVVITPETFNKNGNSFSLAYGYKDDTNRNLWLDYKYQVIWSFHGGLEIRSPWISESSPMLALNPPYRYRSLTIEGEGEQLQKKKVRHAVITINSQINGKQITTRATIRNQGPAPALHLDIPEDINGEPGNVSIIWYLKGGKKVTSSPQKLEGDIVYWDELPEEGRI